MPHWSSFRAFLNEAESTPVEQRQALVDRLLEEHPEWPWIQGSDATFVYVSMGVDSVALNLDTIEDDPPFASMEHLEGTTLWHVTRTFERDDLLDYLLAINDPMTPLAEETDILDRMEKHWRIDPLNTTRMHTAQMSVSVLRMTDARPFPDWKKFTHVPRGKIVEHTINSAQLGFTGRKLWVYTPPGYDEEPDRDYPLLFFQDGQWGVGPLQIPQIADALIKHGHMQPVLIAMTQSGDQRNRIKQFVSNDKHYAYVLTELLPFLQSDYRVDATDLGIGGVSAGGIAAAHAALKNPAVFNHLIMLSPPLGYGIAQDQLREYIGRFEDSRKLPGRIFQSVGRYETRSRFYLPALALNRVLEAREDADYKFAIVGSGHGLVGFRSVLPEALAWTFPGPAQNGTGAS